MNFHGHCLDKDISICTPGVRMVLVSAWGQDGVITHAVDPVVAIRNVTRWYYSIRHVEGTQTRRAPDHAGMIEFGWSFDRMEILVEPIVVDPEVGLIGTETECLMQQDIVSRLVACPWEPSSDSLRLAETIALIRDEALSLWNIRYGKNSIDMENQKSIIES
jgi:hypothetical protein